MIVSHVDLCIEQIFRGLHVFTREICQCQVRIDPVWQHAQTIFDLSRAGGTITKAITVCINVSVVTDTIIVSVFPLAWILREHVSVIAHTIAIGIRSLRRIDWERIIYIEDPVVVIVRVSIITHTVKIGI